MTSGFSISLLISFSSIFEEEPKELKSYLTGISRSKLLNACAFFLGFSTTQSKFEDYVDFLNMFFCEENRDVANYIYEKLEREHASEKARLIIINPLTSLQLFEFSFDNLDDNENQTIAESEISIFKAVLLLNEKNITLGNVGVTSTENVESDIKLAAMALSQTYPYSEFVNYDKFELLTTQTIKSFFLFEFLESNRQTATLLSKFLEYFDCGEWKEFLRNVLPLTFAFIESKKEAHIDIVIGKGEKYESGCNFLEKIIILDTEVLIDYDFKKVRSKPFYKVEEGIYRIIFGAFVLELIHKGVYFKLSEINKTLTGDGKIKDFRSFYCDEFSEKHLLYKLLNSIYQNRYIEYSGQEIRDLGIEAEPDYYIRNGSSLFLFESKDILINAEVKASYDFSKYEQEFKKKLYYDEEKGKNKAILQLICNIERALTLEFKFDKNYKPKSLYIYPILVLHDHQFNIAGLNVIINKWFRTELAKLAEKGLTIQRVQPITIINIDTIIFHQDLFRDKIIRLDFIIDQYIKFVTFDKKRKYFNEEHRNKYAKRTVMTFSLFLSNFVVEKGIRRVPKIFKEKGILLINE